MNLRDRAIQCKTEADTFPVGSMDWEYRTRAAWKYDQWSREVPPNKWTEWPSELVEIAV